MKKIVIRRLHSLSRKSKKKSRLAKRRRIIFVVLAHAQEDILAKQIQNIRYYNPESNIVLYNSSGNPKYGQNIKDMMICPYQRGPLSWGRTGCVLYDVIRWLKEINTDYDYLVYIDSDVLFLKRGLEAYLDEMMLGFDTMGVNMHVEYGPGEWIPGQMMWQEWPQWQELFQTTYLAGMFANGQVYRRELINRMYDGIDTMRLEALFQTTEVIAIEEILHATLAVRSGGRFRSFPESVAEYIRYKPPLSLDDIQAAEQTESVFFVHPVLRDSEDPARIWSERLLENKMAEAARNMPRKKKITIRRKKRHLSKSRRIKRAVRLKRNIKGRQPMWELSKKRVKEKRERFASRRKKL
ncbi:hypothetical protein [Cohnella abietis]|uniref:Nucleotide-diphospho-sugar transferase domain-containing protein n=1 Tax=Cohnella abietis TaxID=2507935 RepID=A0A3T1D7H4_9BACL|nr:hypothetical protein [Cohnella abietis]BBI34036.1 hypothetical protein KCTCHS21_34350 [Cohnella abietis]